MKWLWLILSLALIARLGLLVSGGAEADRFFTPDSSGYDALARNLLAHGTFSRGPDWPAEIFRTPGYPVFLAGSYKLTGGSVELALAIQCLLDTLTAGLVYLLGRRMCNHAVGLAAAGVYAFCPVALAAAAHVWSETLSTFLLAAAMLLLGEYLRRSRTTGVSPVDHMVTAGRNATAEGPDAPGCHTPRRDHATQTSVLWAVGAGIVLGLATLVRPVLGPLTILIVLALLSRIRWWKGAAAVAVMAAACVGPWVWRNSSAAGYANLSSVGDYNLLYYNAAALADAGGTAFPGRGDDQGPSAQSGKSNGPVGTVPPISPTARTMLAMPQAARDRWANEPEFVRQCRREGLAILRAQPGKYAAAHLRATPNVFLPANEMLETAGVTTGQKGTLAVLREQGVMAALRHYVGEKTWAVWLILPLLLVTLSQYVLALAGAVRHVRLRMPMEQWLVLLATVYLVLIPGPAAHARFRAPFAPFIALAAGAGLVWMIEAWRRRKREKETNEPI